MSITEKIENHIKEGRLYRFKPAIQMPPGFQHVRLVLMAEEAYRQCPPSGSATMGDLRGNALDNARATILYFIGGETIYEGQDIKLLEPSDKEVWAMRVLEHPRCRLFGYFVAPDIYLITHCVRRDKLESGLGPEWNRQIEKTVDKRQRLFPDLPPYPGWCFESYVTLNGVAE